MNGWADSGRSCSRRCGPPPSVVCRDRGVSNLRGARARCSARNRLYVKVTYCGPLGVHPYLVRPGGKIQPDFHYLGALFPA